MDIGTVSALLIKEIKGTISSGERAMLETWRSACPEEAATIDEWLLSGSFDADFKSYHTERERTLEKVVAGMHPATTSIHRVRFLRTTWFRYAAVIFLLLAGTAAYFWLFHSHPQTLVSDNKRLEVEIPPGREGAILTLADGSQVMLDSLGNGVVATQNGSRAVLKNGQLAYDPVEKVAGETVYNTITTPKGRQYRILLPDGSKVWLNAASSLNFPTDFSGNERKVALIGEGYFEVSENIKKPFKVHVNGMDVTVLGTNFNVNAYGDDGSFKTTLLEGSVKVSAGNAADVLKPGQQALFKPASGELQRADKVDVDEVMAWKNNELIFNETELRIAMLMLSRWYDFEVVYEDDLPPTYLYGSISRNKGLGEVLKIMDASGLKFRIEKNGTANRLIVMK